MTSPYADVLFSQMVVVLRQGKSFVSRCPRVLKPIKKVLKHSNVNVRAEAVRALGAVVEAVPGLAAEVYLLLQSGMRDREW